MKTINKLVTLVEGIRVGLKAFIMTYILSFVIALVINLSVIEQIQDYLQGTLSQSVGFNLGIVIRTTSIIMNASLFNSSGSIQLGLLVFVLLPLGAFFLADMSDNKKEGMDAVGFIIYAIASLVFTILVLLVSFVTKGELLGMDVQFVSVRNALMTFTITMLIQIAIGMNYNMNRLPGIIATRWMVRLSFGSMTLVSAIALIAIILSFTKNISVVLLGLIMFLPNIAAYGFFMMIGVSVDFNESLEKLMAFGNVQLSYDVIPIGLRIALIIAFVLFALFSVSKIDKDHYIKGLIGFGVTFPLITLLVAYCTVIDLGVVKGLMDIRLGINPISAFVYPMAVTLAVGVLYLVYQDFIKAIKK